MAVRRRRTSANRSHAIKLKQSAALQHNRKLARRVSGAAKNRVSSAEARIERSKKYNRRRQHRRNTNGSALLGLFKHLDPTWWWKAKPSR